MSPTSSTKASQGPGRSARQQALDDMVMATNSSSIVSKRSVERIYYPNEPHFFRFFVKKFQRRAPLINRGYHIRLHVIDVAVRQFLERPSEKTKVVVNLGCGSDVLPWQCLTRYPERCHKTKFVDIDFPDLIKKKCRVVKETPELSSPLTGLKTDVGNNVQLQSDQYVQIGCDLRRIPDIELALSTFIDVSQCEFMFVAEVSITYMETEGADSVIQWASTLGHAEFCLLEQIIPDGEDHPFAKTMLSHFEKLKTPLKSVFTYPDLQAQQTRFADRGWSHVDVSSLWQIWSNDRWLSADERRRLDAIEPFDEWEEFALFASHYCVVIAKAYPGSIASIATTPVHSKLIRGFQTTEIFEGEVTSRDYSGTRGQRRFGAALKLKNHMGHDFLANTFGLGTNSRLRSCDLYTKEFRFEDITAHHTGPSGRMCHTVTDLGDHGSLLTGGRTSPSNALRDCWLFNKNVDNWQPVEDLPVPLYRHAITRLGYSSLALLVGGKSDQSTIFDGCLLYQPGVGWLECEILGPATYMPVFGGLLVCDPHTGRPMTEHGVVVGHEFYGVLAGGISQNGTVANQTLEWALVLPNNSKPTISFTNLCPGSSNPTTRTDDEFVELVNRFGASGFVSPEGYISVVGGIIANDIVTQDLDVLMLGAFGQSRPYRILASCCLGLTPRPLLIGVSTEMIDGQIVIMGGGATCFSMGTYWNPGCYTAPYDPEFITGKKTRSPCHAGSWTFSKVVEVTEQTERQRAYDLRGNDRAAVKIDIPRLQVNTADAFLAILKAGKPVIIEASKLGCCTQTWSSEYIVEQLGPDREVVVHEASSSKMDFNSKNFAYVTKRFGDMMKEITNGHKLYLRALSEDRPSDQPANIKADFPQLVGDFQLPDELSFVTENEFSSVLRITGPVNMWLHYDVMANVYCQVVGSKRFILFPPTDVDRLSFAPGSSSSSIDVFSELESPSLAETHPHEAVLKPGDILFLPPLWMHTASPLSNLGIAVNVFFRNLENGYSAGRDVYGNRDLAAYEKGRQDVARIANSFSKLPPDMRDFYMKRLADELVQKIRD
ncbi:LCM-domain-containing protein [Hypoxylon cercidicola]|nr:LCM-domain-containing protein [Hypoxylon cercidicola]